jgi:hypothetical protein
MPARHQRRCGYQQFIPRQSLFTGGEPSFIQRFDADRLGETHSQHVLSSRLAVVSYGRRFTVMRRALFAQVGGRNLDEHPGVLGHQQTAATWQRATFQLAANETLIGVSIHDQQRSIRLS